MRRHLHQRFLAGSEHGRVPAEFRAGEPAAESAEAVSQVLAGSLERGTQCADTYINDFLPNRDREGVG
jgi:hypothetical protein